MDNLSFLILSGTGVALTSSIVFRKLWVQLTGYEEGILLLRQFASKASSPSEFVSMIMRKGG